MIRFVVGPDGVVPDLKRKLPGRGMWITADRGGADGRGRAQGLRPRLQARGPRHARPGRSDRAAAGARRARRARHRRQGRHWSWPASPRSRRRSPATRSSACCMRRMPAPTASPSSPARCGSGADAGPDRGHHGFHVGPIGFGIGPVKCDTCSPACRACKRHVSGAFCSALSAFGPANRADGGNGRDSELTRNWNRNG